MENKEISEFGYILLFIVTGLLFLILTLFLGKLIRPKRPNEEKNTTYESGEDAHGNAWGMFNPKFYVIALIFLLFEAELLFLFPWATVFGNQELILLSNRYWGKIAVVEMLIFISILALGLCYVWKKGYLDWQKPISNSSNYSISSHHELYQKINKKYETKS
ncbi:MAG: NADH-quinone oxidoreductase subunit A [Cytophagales bacterium]|nr:MAG: NADH-quinone oxidoreductase subunit A [Cytophagales bacterium]